MSTTQAVHGQADVTERDRTSYRQSARYLSPEELTVHANREYRSALLRSVLAKTHGDRPWAEDVVQETMVRLWHYAQDCGPIDVERVLRPLLFTIAHRILIDSIRRRRARPFEVTVIDLEHQAMPDEIDHLLNTLTVRQALAGLDQPHRDVIVQIYLLGYKTIEAADILRIPSGTVRSRVHYALRTMRGALAKYGVTGWPLSV